MKRVLQAATALLAASAFFLLSPAVAHAATSPFGPTQTVNDAGNLLTDAEEATLTNVFQQQYETNQLSIGLATTSTDYSDGSMERLAAAWASQNQLGNDYLFITASENTRPTLHVGVGYMPYLHDEHMYQMRYRLLQATPETFAAVVEEFVTVMAADLRYHFPQPRTLAPTVIDPEETLLRVQQAALQTDLREAEHISGIRVAVQSTTETVPDTLEDPAAYAAAAGSGAYSQEEFSYPDVYILINAEEQAVAVHAADDYVALVGEEQVNAITSELQAAVEAGGAVLPLLDTAARVYAHSLQSSFQGLPFPDSSRAFHSDSGLGSGFWWVLAALIGTGVIGFMQVRAQARPQLPADQS